MSNTAIDRPKSAISTMGSFVTGALSRTPTRREKWARRSRKARIPALILGIGTIGALAFGRMKKYKGISAK
jgi:hypothetical protein